MSSDCSSQNTAVNSAKSALDTATSAYLTCIGPQAAGQTALNDAASDIALLQAQGDTLATLQTFVLRQLRREVDSAGTVTTLKEAASEEADRLRKEIEEVKGEIRLEKRRFLDANPSTTTAVAGLYYTQQPDNQLLIAFLICLFLFLLLFGILIILNKMPLAAGLLGSTTIWERTRIVGLSWVAALLITYIYFFTFT